MENTLLQDTLEYYWVISKEENVLHLPDKEECILSSQFKKKIGDTDLYEECELMLFKKRMYLLSVVIL